MLLIKNNFFKIKKIRELKFMFSIKKYFFSSDHYSFLGYGCYYFLYRQKNYLEKYMNQAREF